MKNRTLWIALVVSYTVSAISALAAQPPKGVELAEDAAKILVVSTLEWLEESAKISENKFDDIIPFSIIKNEALKLVDKIDGSTEA